MGPGTPGGGGYSQKNLVGVCGPLSKTLTLFMIKICDFPYPIYDLAKTLTLFMIKICDFPYPIYDLAKTLTLFMIKIYDFPYLFMTWPKI